LQHVAADDHLTCHINCQHTGLVQSHELVWQIFPAQTTRSLQAYLLVAMVSTLGGADIYHMSCCGGYYHRVESLPYMITLT
jgi:hypothetical protein